MYVGHWRQRLQGILQSHLVVIILTRTNCSHHFDAHKSNELKSRGEVRKKKDARRSQKNRTCAEIILTGPWDLRETPIAMARALSICSTTELIESRRWGSCCQLSVIQRTTSGFIFRICSSKNTWVCMCVQGLVVWV